MDNFENNEVFLPDPMYFQNDWLQTFITEMVGFPKAKHDDIVDSVTQAIKHLSKNPSINVRVL